MRIPTIPFRILALAPFRPQDMTTWREGPLPIDKMSLDEIMAGMGLSLTLNLPKELCPSGQLTLNFSKTKDFHPDGLIKNTPFLKNLVDAKQFVEEAKTKALSTEEICKRIDEWPNLPAIDTTIAILRSKPGSSSSIDDILEMVGLPEEWEDTSAKAEPVTVQIDSILRQILREIFSKDAVRELESAWRGLKFLMKQGGADGEVKLEIVPAWHETLEETLSDLLIEIALDPPDLLVIDLPFDSTPRSLKLLEDIAQFSETLLAPAISWITHKFLHIDTWQDLNKLPYLPHYLEESAFAKWRRLKEISSGRWVAVTCNRFLLRHPYGLDNRPKLVDFAESQGLWASPVWALGCLIGQSVVKMGWPTRFTDWQKVRLEDLALNPVEANRYLPTEASFTEERIEQFVRGGIIPLVSSYNKDVAFMPAETTVAGTSLSYQLLVTRIIRFLFWCKENFEEDLEPTELENNLRKVFALYWESTGQPAPEILDISVSKPDPEKPKLVRFMFEPSRHILPSGEKIEFEFHW